MHFAKQMQYLAANPPLNTDSPAMTVQSSPFPEVWLWAKRS